MINPILVNRLNNSAVQIERAQRQYAQAVQELNVAFINELVSRDIHPTVLSRLDCFEFRVHVPMIPYTDTETIEDIYDIFAGVHTIKVHSKDGVNSVSTYTEFTISHEVLGS